MANHLSRAAWAAPVLTLLVSSQPAAAGPIAWSYHAEATYAEDYGERFALTLSPDGEVSTLPGEQSFVWLFGSTGDPWPEPGEFSIYYGFAVDVTITDRASGESGALAFAGGYLTLWGGPGGVFSIFSSFGSYPDVQILELGGNRYTVRASGGGQGSSPFGSMQVEVNPRPTAATPEPATLALAGLGLAGAGLAGRFRRRGAAREPGCRYTGIALPSRRSPETPGAC